MQTIKVVPGKALKSLIKSGASTEEIANQVRQEALEAGLNGEVAFMIEIPKKKAKKDSSSRFVSV